MDNTPATPATMLPDQAIYYDRVRRELGYKGATGEAVVSRLQRVVGITNMALCTTLSQPQDMRPKLLAAFKSPLALHQHTGAMLTTTRILSKQLADQAVLTEWASMVEAAAQACAEQQRLVEGFFAHAESIAADTKAGYVNQVMNMLALLNALNLTTVLVNPSRYTLELAQKCASPYTVATYISRILSIFKHNPRLQLVYQSAHEAWSKSSSEYRARQLKAARLNQPTSTRQAQNYVPLPDWASKFEQLCSQPDAHSTADASMAHVLMAYACTMPPKRAEMGTVVVFKKAPTPKEASSAPNHIILDTGIMRLTKHKTSKHAMHQEGITEALPASFMKVLEESLSRWLRQALFVDSTGKPHTNQSFSKWVIRTTRRLFGGDKAPGVSLLRHAFCSALDYNKLTGAERDAIALRMGHSGAMQDAYRFLNLDSGSA
jgi:hypothetical protein